jgi:hypothetical protein
MPPPVTTGSSQAAESGVERSLSAEPQSLQEVMGSSGHPPPAIGEKPPLVPHTPRLEPPVQRYKDLEKSDPQLFDQINRIADISGVPRRDLAAVVYASSNNDPNARNGNRVGYGGLTPDDARWVDPDGAMNPADPIDNLFMTAEKLKRLGDQFGRGTPEQYAAYWAGGDRVKSMLTRHPDDHADIAPPGTFNFVNRVVGRPEPHDDGQKSSDMPAWMARTQEATAGAEQTGQLATGAQMQDVPPGSLDPWWKRGSDAVRGAVGSAVQTAEQLPQAVGAAVQPTLDRVAQANKDLVQSAVQGQQAAGQMVRDAAGNVVGAAQQVPSIIEQAPQAIGNAIAKAAEVIRDPAQLGAFAADTVRQAGTALASAATGAAGVAQRDIQGAGEAVAPVAQAVGDYASKFVQGASGNYGGGADNPPPAAPAAPGATGTMTAGGALPFQPSPAAPAPPPKPTGLITPAQAAGPPPPPAAAPQPVPPIAQVAPIVPEKPSAAIGAPPTTGSGSGAAPTSPPVGGAGSQPTGATTGGAAPSPPAAPQAGAAPASGAAPAVGANAPTQPPITSLPGGPSHITPGGAVTAAANGGADGVLTYIVDHGAPGASTGQNWRNLEGSLAAMMIAKGDITGAQHAHEYVYQLQHAGMFEHLKNAYNAMRVGGDVGLRQAAQELAVSHSFATDGAMAGFQIINGKLYVQRFSEDTHQPLGKATEVGLENIRGMLNITADPKTFNDVLNSERQTNNTLEHNRATEGEAVEERLSKERIADMRTKEANTRAELQRQAADERARLQREQTMGIHQDEQRAQTIAELKAQRAAAIKEADGVYGDLAPAPAVDVTGRQMTPEQRQQAQTAYVGVRTHAPDIPTLMAQEVAKSMIAPPGTKGIRFTATPAKDQSGTPQMVIRDLQGNNVAYIPTADLRSLYPTTALTPSQQRATGQPASGR